MEFPERLMELIKEKKITKNKLQKDLNLNKSSILNWTQRGNIPSGDTLSLLATYFNVSVDYLLGISDIKKVPIRKDEDLCTADKRLAEIKQVMSTMTNEEVERLYTIFHAVFGQYGK